MTKPIGSGKNGHADHFAAARAARNNPGAWIPVAEYRALYTARSMVSTIRGGHSHPRITAYLEGGPYEGKYLMTETGYQVFVMWVGDKS